MSTVTGTIRIGGTSDQPLLQRLGDTAGCTTACTWRSHYALIHNGWQIRHCDGEAILIADSAVIEDGSSWQIPEDIARWLKTLHPKEIPT